MKTLTTKIIVWCALMLPVALAAQYNDLGLWQNLSFDKKITRHWVAHISERTRFNENISQLYYFDIDAGITYKLNKNIQFALDYVYIDRRSDKQQFSSRHQYYVDIVAKKKWEQFTFSYRGMLQMEFRDVWSSENGMVPDFIERNKFTIKYKTPWFTPYVASELYWQITEPYALFFNRTRYFIGTFVELNKVDELEFYFLYEDNYMNNNPPKKFVLGLGFKHSFY